MSKKNQWIDTAKEFTAHESFSIVVPEPVVETIKIPFSVWFDRKVKAGKLRKYQDQALLVFFKKQGLTELEDSDVYEKMFKKF